MTSEEMVARLELERLRLPSAPPRRADTAEDCRRRLKAAAAEARRR